MLHSVVIVYNSASNLEKVYKLIENVKEILNRVVKLYKNRPKLAVLVVLPERQYCKLYILPKYYRNINKLDKFPPIPVVTICNTPPTFLFFVTTLNNIKASPDTYNFFYPKLTFFKAF